jgi:RND superfamily putative drug exporter
VACAVAIAVDATVVRLVLVPALMAMFDQWNWWLPRWLDRLLPSVDFEKPLPDVDIGDLVIIPDDISALIAPGHDLRMVVKSAAQLKNLAPDAITVADPLALRGCVRLGAEAAHSPGAADANKHTAAQQHRTATLTATDQIIAVGHNGHGFHRGQRPLHPVTVWRGRLSVALDAIDTASSLNDDTPHPKLQRLSPVETTNVALPTGDRLQIPTGAETLRLKAYLIICRNSSRDFAEFADLVDTMGARTAAAVLTDMDEYYRVQPSEHHWVTSELVRRLADPHPADEAAEPSGADAEADWERVNRNCLSVAVAMLEESR